MFNRVFLLFLLISTTLFSNDKVSLQLLWQHQFEFAGFYMAKEKGFYKNSNLDVEFKEFEFGIDIVEDVQNGESTFGVSYPNIILDRSNGAKVVLLNSIYQSSPHILISLKSSGIKSIKDFKNKKIMIENNAIKTVPIVSMLYSKDIRLIDMTIIKPSFNVDDVISKRTDIFSAYISNEIYKLNDAKISYDIWDPKDYGFDFYNDILFTSSKELKNNPAKVKRFQEASLKGWEYAFANIDETVDVILKKYNTRNKAKEALLYEAKELKRLAYKDNLPLGDIDKNKIQRIYDIYNLMGLVQNKIDLDEFVHYPNTKRINFTLKELKYLKSHPVITVHNELNWPPYNFNVAGKPKGFSIDCMNLLASKLGIKVKYISGPSWSEFLTMVKDEKLDVMLNIRDTSQRREFINFTRYYIEASKSIFTNNSKLKTLKDLSGKTVAVPKDFIIHRFLENNFPSIKLNIQKDVMSSIIEVIEGRADAVVSDFGVTKYLMQDKGFSFKYISVIKDKRLTTKMNIGTSLNQPILRDILQKAMDVVSDEERNTIKNRWLGKSNKKSVKLTKEERLFILEHPVITVHNEQNWPPYNFIEDGEAKGFSVDYMNLLASKLGIKVEYKTGSTWTEFMEMLKSNRLDVMLNIRRMEERDRVFNFTKPYVKSAKTIFTNLENINSLKDLRFKTIAVPRNYYMHKFLTKYYPDIKLNIYDNTLDCIISVIEKKSDAVIDSFYVVNYLMLQNGINLKYTKIVTNKHLTNYMNMATSKEHPILRDILQKAMDEVSDEEKNSLMNRWFGVANSLVKKNVGLSYKEKQWIKENIVTIGASNWGLINKIDESKQLDGITGDLLKLIIKDIGLKVEYKSGTWTDLIVDFKKQKIDLLPAVYYTKDRATFGYFSKPYFYLKEYIYVKQNSGIKSFEDLKGKRVAIIKDYGTISKIQSKYPTIKIVQKDNIESAINSILEGETEAYIELQVVAQNYLDTNLIIGIKGISQNIFEASPIHFFSNIKEPVLKSILSKALKLISESEKNKIISKWLNSSQNKDKFPKQNLLNEKEQYYLKNNKIIKMCNNLNWEPIEFAQNGNLNSMKGIAIDTLRELEKKLGVKFVNVPTKNWSQSQQFLKDKKCDILPAAIKTVKREEYAKFTRPYLNYKLAIVTKNDKPFVRGIEDVVDKSISRKEGSGLITKLKRQYPDINIVETKDYLESLQKVSSGEVYCTIATLPIVSHYVNNFTLNNLHVAGYTNMIYQLSIAVRDDKPLLLSILDKALTDISSQAHKDIYAKWTNIKIKEQFDYKLLKQISMIFILVWAFFIYRQYLLNKSNKNLKDMVLEQTKELKAINKELEVKSYNLKEINENLEQKVVFEIDKATKMEKKLFESEKMAAMGEMIGNIAHQWRQPLSIIATSATGIIMQKEYDILTDDKLIQSMNDINNSAQFLSKTIDDFRDLIKGDAMVERFNLSENIEKCLTIERPMLKVNNIALIENFDDKIILESYPNALIQSMINIINNAKDILKDKRSQNSYIFIETFIDKQNAIITVKDNGGGIPEDILPHIFEPYFTTKHKSKGTGLGLSMTYNMILKDMRGVIEAKNVNYNYDEISYDGALFTIKIPLEYNKS